MEKTCSISPSAMFLQSVYMRKFVLVIRSSEPKNCLCLLHACSVRPDSSLIGNSKVAKVFTWSWLPPPPSGLPCLQTEWPSTQEAPWPSSQLYDFSYKRVPQLFSKETYGKVSPRVWLGVESCTWIWYKSLVFTLCSWSHLNRSLTKEVSVRAFERNEWLVTLSGAILIFKPLARPPCSAVSFESKERLGASLRENLIPATTFTLRGK